MLQDILAGHAQSPGCGVVFLKAYTVFGVGSYTPGSHETDLLAPVYTFTGIYLIVLSGESDFGL